MLFSIWYSQYSDYVIRHLRFCLFSLGWLAGWLAVGPRGGYTEAVLWHVGNYGWSCPPIWASHGHGKRREAQTAAFSGSLGWRNRLGYPGHQPLSLQPLATSQTFPGETAAAAPEQGVFKMRLVRVIDPEMPPAGRASCHGSRGHRWQRMGESEITCPAIY